jgi:hypothetical protein
MVMLTGSWNLRTDACDLSKLVIPANAGIHGAPQDPVNLR